MNIEIDKRYLGREKQKENIGNDKQGFSFTQNYLFLLLLLLRVLEKGKDWLHVWKHSVGRKEGGKKILFSPFILLAIPLSNVQTAKTIKCQFKRGQ